MISHVFCLLVGLYSVRKCENSSWGLWAKAFLMFYLDVDSLYWDKTKYILQYFAYQEALIKSFFFTILVKTADLRGLSCCLKLG